MTMAAVDWLMSLEPHWYSTIFGIYIFAGGGLAFMAALILISLAFRRGGVARGLHHTWTTTTTWAGGSSRWWSSGPTSRFSQYLLIWYANLPGGDHLVQAPAGGELDLGERRPPGLGNFILPFLLLISRGAKRNLRLLGVGLRAYSC